MYPKITAIIYTQLQKVVSTVQCYTGTVYGSLSDIRPLQAKCIKIHSERMEYTTSAYNSP